MSDDFVNEPAGTLFGLFLPITRDFALRGDVIGSAFYKRGAGTRCASHAAMRATSRANRWREPLALSNLSNAHPLPERGALLP